MKETDHISRYITFKLADNLLAVNILDIREIVSIVEITEVQHAPDIVLGLINLRGQILTVLDVRLLLSFESVPNRNGSHIIIFKHHNVGFVVDEIGDMISAKSDQREDIPVNIDPKIKSYMEHVIQNQSDLIMTVNAAKILEYSPITEGV